MGLQNIIVAFSKPDDAKNIKSILTRSGFNVVAVCTSGAQVLSSAEELNSAVLVCGYRLSDMVFEELQGLLPQELPVLLIASPARVEDIVFTETSIFLPMPLKVHELLATLELMLQRLSYRRRKAKERGSRSEADRRTINAAKELLMARNNMSEPEAHRYLQKCAMDSGTGMTETAEMILSLMSG